VSDKYIVNDYFPHIIIDKYHLQINQTVSPTTDVNEEENELCVVFHLSHLFVWRLTKDLPHSGNVSVFRMTRKYEDVFREQEL